AWPVLSPHAHARVLSVDTAGELVLDGAPGEANSGASRHDEPLFPAEVMYHQQPVVWALGESLEAAQRSALRVRVQSEPLSAILTIEDAIGAQSYHSGPHRLSRGSVGAAPRSIEFELRIGGQEHFYLETQSAIAWLDEAGGVSLHSSTQHPSETQEVVARVL